jgi:hypothetical protein
MMAPALVVQIVTAVMYFENGQADARRIWVAAHPAPLLLAGLYALFVASWSQRHWNILIWPFAVLIALSAGWLLYALARFQGNKAVHLMQLLQVPSAVYLWICGTMTISHDWG